MKSNINFLIVALFIYSCDQFHDNNFRESLLPDLDVRKEKGHMEEDSLESGNLNNSNIVDLTKNGRTIKGYKTGTWHYSLNDKECQVSWVIYEDSLIKINHPQDWDIKRDSELLFYSKLNNNKNNFFLIKRYAKADIKISLDGYIREAIYRLIRRNNEKITDYACFKLEYEERNAYFLRFDEDFANNLVEYYSFYTEDNYFIYDFTLRVGFDKLRMNKEIFGTIIYSLCINGDKLFHYTNELIRTTNIRLEDLD